MNAAALYYGDDACVVDPFAASLRYAARFNGGTAGIRPTTNDDGTVTYSSDSPSTTVLGYSTDWKYWPTYTSSLRVGAPMRATTVSGNPIPWAAVGSRGDFSIMLRCRPTWDPGGVFGDQGLGMRKLLSVTANFDGGYGQRDTLLTITCHPTSSTIAHLQLNFASDDGNNVKSISTSDFAVFGTNMELLVTRGVYTGPIGFGRYTQFFVNGVMVGTPTAVVPTTILDPNTVSMWLGDQLNYVNDCFVWSACIATASYAPATQPFC